MQNVDFLITRFNYVFFKEGIIILSYHNVPKFLDTQNLYCKHSKILTKRFYHGVIPPNDANRIANIEDPDQTAPSLGRLLPVWVCSVLGMHCLPRPVCPKT